MVQAHIRQPLSPSLTQSIEVIFPCQICVSGYTFSHEIKRTCSSDPQCQHNTPTNNMLKTTGAAAQLFAVTEVMCRLQPASAD